MGREFNFTRSVRVNIFHNKSSLLATIHFTKNGFRIIAELYCEVHYRTELYEFPQKERDKNVRQRCMSLKKKRQETCMQLSDCPQEAPSCIGGETALPVLINLQVLPPPSVLQLYNLQSLFWGYSPFQKKTRQ